MEPKARYRRKNHPAKYFSHSNMNGELLIKKDGDSFQFIEKLHNSKPRHVTFNPVLASQIECGEIAVMPIEPVVWNKELREIYKTL